MRLSDLKSGETAVIVKVLGHGAFRKRVMEMGFVKGRKIKAILSAPLKDPVKYSLMGYEVSLRRSEAEMIEVVPIEADYDNSADIPKVNVGESEDYDSVHRERYEGERRTVNVALIGNPNCGKTSLFNVASGAQEHVGNYSGVTVDSKTGVFRHGGYTFRIVDLPGTYSLSAYSPEERYVRRYLRDHNPDIIVNVVDGSNLERNMYLTTELIDMDHPMVIALNMYDEMRNAGTVLDYEALGSMIGVPVVPTVSRTGEGVGELFDTIIEVYERRNPVVRHVHVRLGHDLEEAVADVKDAIKADKSVNPHYSPRYLAIKLMEGDAEAENAVREMADADRIFGLRDRDLAHLSQLHPEEDVSAMIAGEKYGFISGALAETMQKSTKQANDTTRMIDALVTSRLFGFPIFILAMLFIFWFTFFVGKFPQEWIETGVAWLADMVNSNMADGPLKDLLMGFGCNVPAIMAARAIESRSSRAITVLITPFMSCSARLPVYVLLIGTFFEAHAALVFLGMYILGVVIAVLTARILRKFFFKRDETPFVMELPPYRVPTMKTSLRHMWAKGKQYLSKMGGIILLASVIVWALNYFPLRDVEPAGIQSENIAGSDEINPRHDSYLEMMGKAVNPVLAPLGFSWRATVAAVAGVPAKEIVVSTLGVLYTGSEEASEHSLSQRLSTSLTGAGKPDFNRANALSFMIFILLYCPCVATIVAIVKETRSWRYGLFTIIYNTAVAWFAAFIAYRVALLF